MSCRTTGKYVQYDAYKMYNIPIFHAVMFKHVSAQRSHSIHSLGVKISIVITRGEWYLSTFPVFAQPFEPESQTCSTNLKSDLLPSFA